MACSRLSRTNHLVFYLIQGVCVYVTFAPPLTSWSHQEIF